MSQNLLKNGDFEADWGEENSHHCAIFPKSGAPYEKDVGNVFTPPHWVTWFHHDPGTWDQPEVRDAWKQHDPRRAHSGQKGILLFTFFRRHDAGFFQQVQATPGTRLRLTAWGHAWSNHQDRAHPDRFPHPDDGKWSDGPGYDAAFRLEGEASDDNWRNFTFYVGIDPTGGTNPLADTVVWGQGAHIYNEYVHALTVEAEAQTDTVTVFLRSKTLWPFKHNDAYWDDVELTVVEAPPEVEISEPEPVPTPSQARPGAPRVQYERTYILLSPDAGIEWAHAVLNGAWGRQFTIGTSADDAGIGTLNYRRVIAVNPSAWKDDLAAFFAEHYPGVVYVPIETDSPVALEQKLKALE